jgi:hypothetical protein
MHFEILTYLLVPLLMHVLWASFQNDKLIEYTEKADETFDRHEQPSAVTFAYINEGLFFCWEFWTAEYEKLKHGLNPLIASNKNGIKYVC